MKHTISILAPIAILAFAAPAMACDMHGGGYNGGAFGMNWTSYSPQASYTDPAFTDSEYSDFSSERNYTPLPKTPRAKPSFSSAATDAAEKARLRLVKSETKSDTKPGKTKSEVVQKTSLESN